MDSLEMAGEKAMDYQMDLALYGGIFAVPNAIVDQYLKLATGNTLKVLLVFLRHSGQPLSLELLMAATNLTQTEVFDALLFWTDLEVLNLGKSAAVVEASLASPRPEPIAITKSWQSPIENPGAGLAGDALYAADPVYPGDSATAKIWQGQTQATGQPNQPGEPEPLTRPCGSTQPEPLTRPSGSTPEGTTDSHRHSEREASPPLGGGCRPQATGGEPLTRPSGSTPEGSTPEGKTSSFRIISSAPPRPSRREAAEQIEASEALRFLLAQYRDIFGKDPSGLILSSMVMLNDYCAMPADLLGMFMHYCKSIGMTDWQSIERKILYCKEIGVDTHEKAEAYIMNQSREHQNETTVRRIFGITGRNLTTRERDFIRQWFADFGFGEEMVTLAYERGVDSTAKLSFAYIHKILQNWFEKGLKTLEAAMAESAPRAPQPGKKQKESPQKFHNTSYDIDELEREAMYHTPKI